MRALVPAETLVYLESNDIGAALQPIVDNKAFEQAAKTKPDLSVIKGVQLAVAVTGFESTEEKLNDELSVGNIRPRFVAIADTHAWNWQANTFAEQHLGGFVADIYNSDTSLEKLDKNGGKYFVWTAADGRKAYALVIDSIIYFGNDETAIEKCLAVKRGEADSIVKTGKVKPAGPATLATGYLSTDGVAQIASIVGMKLAFDIADAAEIQSAIARIAPQLIRGLITEVRWSAVKTEEGIEDEYAISMTGDAAAAFNETFATGDETPANTRVNNVLLAQLPPETNAATRYNLKNPQIAWRSVLLVAQSQLDVLGSKIVSVFAGAILEDHGISDPELFLSSLAGPDKTGRSIVTATLKPDPDESVVVASRGNDQITVRSLSPDLKPPKETIEGGTNIWSTEDRDVQLVFDGDIIKIGSEENLRFLSGVRSGELTDIRSDLLRKLAASKAPIVTAGEDMVSAVTIADVLSQRRQDSARANYVTETRFTRTGIERRTISDFGLIGSIISQLGTNE
jgi:hypothetical protein